MLDIPAPDYIPGYNKHNLFPYTFVADEGFGMKPHMMRPYARGNKLDISQVIFNYRLSRARRVIENAFGVLSTRFRIFRRQIIAHVENVNLITKAAIALNNFLLNKETHMILIIIVQTMITKQPFLD